LRVKSDESGIESGAHLTLSQAAPSGGNDGDIWFGYNDNLAGAANKFWATPDGASGLPSLRAIVAADIPALSYEASGAVSTHNGLASAHGFTTVGKAIANLTNPGAITFVRANADNSATLLSASDMRTALGLGTAATHATGDYDAAGAAAAVTPTTLGLVIGRIRRLIARPSAPSPALPPSRSVIFSTLHRLRRSENLPMLRLGPIFVAVEFRRLRSGQR